MSTPQSSAASPQYVFVVTYGRSGSTLTQGMLNTLPRTLVRGENNLYLLPLYRAYNGLKTFAEKFAGAGAAKPTSAFYGLRETDLDGFADFVAPANRDDWVADVPPLSFAHGTVCPNVQTSLRHFAA